MTFNGRSPAVKRLLKEALELSKPTELYHATPIENNLFEWHFTIRGPEGSDFQGGIYHGTIFLPSEYPMKPPNIEMLTPNGRFETHRKICLSISGYHPESWRPSWSIRTVLLALIGFMPTHAAGAIGSLDMPKDERIKLARRSQHYKCDICGHIRGFLLPLTEASAELSKEANEAASQLSLREERPLTKDTKSEQAEKSTIDTSSVQQSIPVDQGIQSFPQPFLSSPSTSAISQTPIPTFANLPIAYWLCFPVYSSDFSISNSNCYIPPGAFTPTTPVLSTSHSITGTSTSPSGSNVPLSFSDWLKEARKQSKPNEPNAASNEPVSISSSSASTDLSGTSEIKPVAKNPAKTDDDVSTNTEPHPSISTHFPIEPDDVAMPSTTITESEIDMQQHPVSTSVLNTAGSSQSTVAQSRLGIGTYRAVNVCAFAVAVALFMLVFRRMVLMVQGV